MTSHPFRIVLFGLTGFANPVLQALLESNDEVELAAVFTPHFEEPYPYYDVESLEQLCLRHNVVCHTQVKPSSEEGIALLQNIQPDLVIVSSFYEILRAPILAIPKFGIVNIHPSLLPRFRGRHPTKSAILLGDTESGITFHYLTESVDTGDILLQRSCSLDNDETDSTLRLKLGKLAGASIPQFVDLLRDYKGRPPCTHQDESKVLNCKKINYERLTLETSPNVETCLRRFKALTKFPGATILIDGKKELVIDVDLLQERRPDGLYKQEQSVDLFVDGAGIRLFLQS